MRLQLFFLLQFLTTIYALDRGGKPEKFVGIVTLVALETGWLFPAIPSLSYRSVEVGPLLIDFSLAVLLMACAATADRYWPIWIAALQLLAIAVHALRAIQPDLVPFVYNRLIGWLGYPMLIVLVVGVYRFGKRAHNGELRSSHTV